MSEQHAPYKTLGTHLKYLREQSNESLPEVSGAVEIEELLLQKIEEGRLRPDEDILLLLISHFAMPDQEAVQLWELAGYDGAPDLNRSANQNTSDEVQKAVVMFMSIDPRAVYSDGIDIVCNNAGVTLSFTQDNGKPQQNIVSKVGMSYEQAERLQTALNYALLKARYIRQPKQLPPTISND